MYIFTLFSAGLTVPSVVLLAMLHKDKLKKGEKVDIDSPTISRSTYAKVWDKTRNKVNAKARDD